MDKKDCFLPVYHVYPFEGGYINDVNAFFKFNGRYHLFYQYSFNVDDTSDKEWVHAVSDDLIRWEYLGVALACDRPFDKKGAWSGNVFFDKDGAPVIIYYAYSSGICIARPKDLTDKNLKEWVKDDKNPVIPMPDSGAPYKIYDVSNVWLNNGYYYLVSGNKTVDTDLPMTFLFRSKDLYKWDFVGEFFTPTGLEPKDDIACQNLTPLGNGELLFTFSSHYGGVQYYTGRFKGEKFLPVKHGRFNYYGGNEMGQGAFFDGDRLLYMSWLTDMRRGEELYSSGWCGTLTLPKEIYSDGNGGIKIYPAKEVLSLRGEKACYGLTEADGRKPLDFCGRAFEADIAFAAESTAGLEVGSGEGEKTLIFYSAADGTVKIDYSGSSQKPYCCNKYMFEVRDYEYLGVQSSFKIAPENGKINMRVFMDNSVLEVYVNGISMSRRIYPSASSDNVALISEGKATFEKVDFYKLKEIYR